METFATLWFLTVVLWGTMAAPEQKTCFRNETYQVSMRVKIKVPIEVKVYTWCFRVPPRCSKFKTEYRDKYDVHVETRSRQVAECCDGYKEISGVCWPECPRGCIWGSCERPGKCACSPGFGGEKCEDLLGNVTPASMFEGSGVGATPPPASTDAGTSVLLDGSGMSSDGFGTRLSYAVTTTTATTRYMTPPSAPLSQPPPDVVASPSPVTSAFRDSKERHKMSSWSTEFKATTFVPTTARAKIDAVGTTDIEIRSSSNISDERRNFSSENLTSDTDNISNQFGESIESEATNSIRGTSYVRDFTNTPSTHSNKRVHLTTATPTPIQVSETGDYPTYEEVFIEEQLPTEEVEEMEPVVTSTTAMPTTSEASVLESADNHLMSAKTTESQEPKRKQMVDKETQTDGDWLQHLNGNDVLDQGRLRQVPELLEEEVTRRERSGRSGDLLSSVSVAAGVSVGLIVTAGIIIFVSHCRRNRPESEDSEAEAPTTDRTASGEEGIGAVTERPLPVPQMFLGPVFYPSDPLTDISLNRYSRVYSCGPDVPKIQSMAEVPMQFHYDVPPPRVASSICEEPEPLYDEIPCWSTRPSEDRQTGTVNSSC